MKIITKSNYVINRGGERIVADEKGVIETNNKEAIAVLEKLFPKASKAPKDK